MKPTNKRREIAEFLESNYGRTSAIESDKCIPKPIGCGGTATNFRNELSRREYAISGLCQVCQDLIFGRK